MSASPGALRLLAGGGCSFRSTCYAATLSRESGCVHVLGAKARSYVSRPCRSLGVVIIQYSLVFFM